MMRLDDILSETANRYVLDFERDNECIIGFTMMCGLFLVSDFQLKGQ